MDTEFESRIDLTELNAHIENLKHETANVVKGQKEVVELLLTALLANGHVLLEGVPGVAKTLMVKTLSQLIHTDFKRLQFTPDLMPSDVVGTSVLDSQKQNFTFRRGPVFTEFLLVDEINRAPAKTQASLFECMQERQVTFDGVTYPLSEYFMVFATQNPIDNEGTYRLPEAQMDRFVMKINVGYPDHDAELDILREYNVGNELHEYSAPSALLTREELKALRSMLPKVVVDDAMLEYICSIMAATRESQHTWIGASPRASIALLQTAKAHALLSGRDFVTPDDIHFLAPYVLGHRITLTAESELNGLTVKQFIEQVIKTTAPMEK